jgi:hypothetical protein
MSELTDILDEAEDNRLAAEREALQVQLDAVLARINDLDDAIAARRRDTTTGEPAEWHPMAIMHDTGTCPSCDYLRSEAKP